MTARTDGGDHVEMEAGDSCLNHGYFSDRSPCLPGMKIRPYSRFILKIDGGLDFFSFLFGSWKIHLDPLLNRLLIVLIGEIKRLLVGNAELQEKTSRRTQTELNPEFVFDRRDNQ